MDKLSNWLLSWVLVIIFICSCCCILVCFNCIMKYICCPEPRQEIIISSYRVTTNSV